MFVLQTLTNRDGSDETRSMKPIHNNVTGILLNQSSGNKIEMKQIVKVNGKSQGESFYKTRCLSGTKSSYLTRFSNKQSRLNEKKMEETEKQLKIKFRTFLD